MWDKPPPLVGGEGMEDQPELAIPHRRMDQGAGYLGVGPDALSGVGGTGCEKLKKFIGERGGETFAAGLPLLPVPLGDEIQVDLPPP